MRTALIIIFSLQLMACQPPQREAEESSADSAIEASEANDKEVVCFVYHRFGDSRYPSTNIALKDFEAHLNYLKNNGYQVLTLSEAKKYLKSSQKEQKTAVITIDDGYKSFIQNGLPLLRKYDFPATLFINTETVGGGDYMDWEEIEKAMNNKIEIGNHTHSHDYFLNMPEASRYQAFEEEIKLSQQIIVENIGISPTSFAYPYGELDPNMKKIVAGLGFEIAAAQNSGVIYSGTDLMQCPRFPMSEVYASIDKFTAKANMHTLRVSDISTGSFIIPENESQPELSFSVNSTGLQLDRLQCFIQGAECDVKQTVTSNSTATISIKPETGIDNKRRTLYTVTVPDSAGNWYWFSHLFINSKMK